MGALEEVLTGKPHFSSDSRSIPAAWNYNPGGQNNEHHNPLATPTEDPNWKQRFTTDMRLEIIKKMFDILLDSVRGYALQLDQVDNLKGALVNFEISVFDRSLSKAEYVQSIREKIVSLRNPGGRKPTQSEPEPEPEIEIGSPIVIGRKSTGPPVPVEPAIQSTPIDIDPNATWMMETSHPGLRFDIGAQGVRYEDPLKFLDVPEDLYEKAFFHQRHFNFIGFPEGSAEGAHVISICCEPKIGVYKALRNTKLGMEPLGIAESSLNEAKLGKSDSIEKKLKKVLDETFPGMVHTLVTHPQFAEQLLQIEKKHPQNDAKKGKVAVIFAKDGQKTAQEFFKNETTSGFQEFIGLLGHEIDLEGWQGYRGDMRGGKGWFTEWQGFQIMYHVSTMLNSEQHRRLIGNDIITIFFHEGEVFDPSGVDLGQVPQIFILVQPYTVNSVQNYRVSVYSRWNIPNFLPRIPYRHVFSPAQLKDFLLTIIVNGKFVLMGCPPMNRLFYVPRGASLDELASNFREGHKVTNTTKTVTSTLQEDLFVQVISCRNLVSRDNDGLSDPYCTLSIKDQHFRTEVVRDTLSPEWDQTFSFNLSGMNQTYADLKIVVRDWDRISKIKSNFMGQIVLPLNTIRRLQSSNAQDSAMWFSLQPKKEGTSDRLYGEIQLKFHFAKGDGK